MQDPRTLEARIQRALMASGVWDAPAVATRAARTLARLGARAIALDDPEYPVALRDLHDAPPVLFVRGSRLPSVAKSVAVVGSRAASRYGTEIAHRLASDLVRLGYTVVSGLARGVDAAAHRGALAAGGETVAVLPSGLDQVTPSHHRSLADEIAASGTLVSELATGGPRFRAEFVKRNRIIAGLSSATVVVEAAPASGALTTARFAEELKRPVLAVPGDVDRPTSHGTNALLKRGAIVCENAADVTRAVATWSRRIPALPPAAPPAAAPALASAPTPAPGPEGGTEPICGPEARLLEVLGSEGVAVEDLAARAGMDLPQALAALLALQWAGAAEIRPGQRWAKRT